MITVLARRLPARAAALLAAAMLMLAALAAGLTYSSSAGPAVADNGVIHSDGTHSPNKIILAKDQAILADGIQGSGQVYSNDGGIHGVLIISRTRESPRDQEASAARALLLPAARAAGGRPTAAS